MEPRCVVIFDEIAGNALGVFKIKRGERTYGMALKGLMEAFDFAVGLRVIRTGHDVAGLPLSDEGFELSAFELGALISDDPGARLGINFAGFLQDDFRVDLAHGRANIPSNDHARATVEYGTKKVEDAADVSRSRKTEPVCKL